MAGCEMISLIVPLYNGKKYINRICKMVRENEKYIIKKGLNIDVELIVVNDYEKETIYNEDFCLKSQNIISINNEHNLGIHKTKIKGMTYAHGDYICFLDQDDLISDSYIYLQYSLIKGYDAVVCNTNWETGLLYNSEASEATDLRSYYEGWNGIISLGQVLIKKNAIPKEWIEKPLINNGADDYYLMMLMLLKGQKVYEHRNVLYYHVLTGCNLSIDEDIISSSINEALCNINKTGLISSDIIETALKKRYERVGAYYKEQKELARNYPAELWLERIVNNRIIYILEKYSIYMIAGYNIDNYLKTLSCDNMAIYGAGRMGKFLELCLRTSKCRVVSFIDKNKKGSLNEIPIIDIDEAIDNENLYDVIVVTPFVNTSDIVDELENIFDCFVITFETVINNMNCCIIDK